MKEKDILIQKYHSNSLSVEESGKLEEMIEKGEVSLEEIEEFSGVLSLFEINEQLEPSVRMDERFFETLQKASETPVKIDIWSNISSIFLKWALPMVLIVITFFVGQEIGKDNSSLAEAQITLNFSTQLLATENVNDKINLVSNTKITEDTDQKVIEALLFALNSDESTNVRLACVNTLYDYSYLPEVRTGLINAISNQTSPLVLSNLAEAINASGKKISPDDFKSRIKTEMPKPLRNLVEESMTNI